MGLPKIPFTSQNASINRVRIVNLPGIKLDDAVVGEQAYNLLSAPAIVHYTLNHASSLNLPEKYQAGDVNRLELRRDLPLFLDACLYDPDPVVRDSANQIARQLGRNLGYLLITLHRGDSVNKQARDDWTVKEWDHWHAIRNTHLGGGIVSGHLGNAILDSACKLISSAGYSQFIHVDKSHYARVMTVVGACRYLPPDTNYALCLDIGHTSVKAAVAHFVNNQLLCLKWMPMQDVGWSWRNDPDAGKEISPHEVVQFVTRELIRSWKTASANNISLDRDIMICIASYVKGGQLLGNGIYGRMSLLAEDVRVLLGKILWDDAHIKAKIHLIHDGTSAAAVHAGEADTAVLVLGTAIGVGFAPASSDHLRSISPVLQHYSLDSA